MLHRSSENSASSLYPEDLECVSIAFELTLPYLHDNQCRFDLPSARDFAAEVIMAKAMGGERNAYRLWMAAVHQLQSREAVTALAARGRR